MSMNNSLMRMDEQTLALREEEPTMERMNRPPFSRLENVGEKSECSCGWSGCMSKGTDSPTTPLPKTITTPTTNNHSQRRWLDKTIKRLKRLDETRKM